jgi:hypothetical protein
VLNIGSQPHFIKPLFDSSNLVGMSLIFATLCFDIHYFSYGSFVIEFVFAHFYQNLTSNFSHTFCGGHTLAWQNMAIK